MSDPLSVDPVLRQAIGHHQAGRIEQAILLYRQILAGAPDRAEVLNNLGTALAAQGKLDEAVFCYRRALVAAPQWADAHINLGNVLHAQGKSEDAARAYRDALVLAPDDAGTLSNLGNLLLREPGLAPEGRIAESFACLTRHARLAYAPGGAVPSQHKFRHDREQQEYLETLGAEAEISGFHLADGSRLASPAVNPANAADIVAQWQTGRPPIVVIDNFLAPEALEKLRRFCWGSTIWQAPHRCGYLTALPEHGLACPLLAQIAEELPAACPAIFHPHPLRYLWAFKYDNRLAGVGLHADQAAVNVNFWITPDEANLDPASGGLKVWDIAAPQDWNFTEFNGDAAAAREFLARTKARPAIIPYRANRAVIFDSDLFHETDKMVFRDGYLNRRINLTLLYGCRDKPQSLPAAPG